jgi:NitT/TauT family transport system substrate-binding protein
MGSDAPERQSSHVSRRAVVSAFTGMALAGFPTRSARANTMSGKAIRLILNTGLSGPVSFFLLSEDKGHLKAENVSVEFSTGAGAAAVVPEVGAGRNDAGYGDITALIERIARGRPGTEPVAVWTTFNTVPFTIAVAADGPVKAPKDFAGRVIAGHPRDAALLTFDMFARAAGLDAASVKVLTLDDGMGQQVAAMLAGRQSDGVFGFVNTIIASVAPLGIRPEQIRFINYSDVLPEMYGNTLFVTRDLATRRPEAVRGMVRAFNLGLRDAIAAPEASIDAVIRRAPGANRQVNLTRLLGTFSSEMAHPEGARIGIGDMDDSRLERLIALTVEAKKLPRKPTVREVFDRSFLPPDAERIRSLAR